MLPVVIVQGWLVMWAMRSSVHDFLQSWRVWAREAHVYTAGFCFYQSGRIRIVIVGNPWMSGPGVSLSKKSQHNILITKVLNRLNDCRGPVNLHGCLWRRQEDMPYQYIGNPWILETALRKLSFISYTLFQSLKEVSTYRRGWKCVEHPKVVPPPFLMTAWR